MAAGLIADLCKPIDLDLDCADLFALFPGGVELGAGPGHSVPVVQDCARDLVGLLNGALAPLAPLFTILEAVMCVIEVVKAIPDSLGPPPDPTAIARKLVECSEKFEKLVSLIPAISVPKMVKQILAIVIAALRALRAELSRILDLRVRINTAEARAQVLRQRFPSAADELLAAVSCASVTETAMMVAAKQNAAPLNRLIAIVNVLLQLAGQDPIAVGLTLGERADSALAPLDELIAMLTSLRSVIPG